MKKHLLVLPLLGGLSFLSSLTAGCGGGDAMTLDAYLTELDAIFDEVDERFAALEEGEDLGTDASAEEIKNSVLQSVDDTGEVLGDATGKIEELEPPDEIKDEHEELVGGLEQFTSGLDSYRDEVEAAETQSDLEEIFAREDPADIQEAGERIDAVCVALQGEADANSIDVDLECEE